MKLINGKILKIPLESLSDSTIYMAYYTVAHYLQELKEEQLTESLFDAIFGAGNIDNIQS